MWVPRILILPAAHEQRGVGLHTPYSIEEERKGSIREHTSLRYVRDYLQNMLRG